MFEEFDFGADGPDFETSGFEDHDALDTAGAIGNEALLVDSAMEAARLNRTPPPCAIIDVPGFDNAGMDNTDDLDLSNDIRVGDSERVACQELKYGAGGALPEALHEEAHRLPRINKGIWTQYGPRAEEAICDIRAGMLSGHVGAPREAFRGEIGETEGDEMHPDGCDRVPYFEEAYDLAASDPFRDFVHPDRNPFLREKIRDVERRAVREFGDFNLYE